MHAHACRLVGEAVEAYLANLGVIAERPRAPRP
jgi:hypothetical protein